MSLLDGLLEPLAGAEPWDPALGDLDGRPGPGIARRPGLAVRDLERAETDERYRVALLQRSGDAVDQRVDRRRRRGLGHAGVLGDLGHDFLFVHESSSRSAARDVCTGHASAKTLSGYTRRWQECQARSRNLSRLREGVSGQAAAF